MVERRSPTNMAERRRPMKMAEKRWPMKMAERRWPMKMERRWPMAQTCAALSSTACRSETAGALHQQMVLRTAQRQRNQDAAPAAESRYAHTQCTRPQPLLSMCTSSFRVLSGNDLKQRSHIHCGAALGVPLLERSGSGIVAKIASKSGSSSNRPVDLSIDAVRAAG